MHIWNFCIIVNGPRAADFTRTHGELTCGLCRLLRLFRFSFRISASVQLRMQYRSIITMRLFSGIIRTRSTHTLKVHGENKNKSYKQYLLPFYLLITGFVFFTGIYNARLPAGCYIITDRNGCKRNGVEIDEKKRNANKTEPDNKVDWFGAEERVRCVYTPSIKPNLSHTFKRWAKKYTR